jgi:hypothetical protein
VHPTIDNFLANNIAGKNIDAVSIVDDPEANRRVSLFPLEEKCLRSSLVSIKSNILTYRIEITATVSLDPPGRGMPENRLRKTLPETKILSYIP